MKWRTNDKGRDAALRAGPMLCGVVGCKIAADDGMVWDEGTAW